VAQAFFDTPRAILKVNCAEFQHSHEVAKLVGSPPGYLGHRETHAYFSQQALVQHYTEEHKFSLVLFDEIEKASDALWMLLLGILDKGTLTLGDNKVVDFTNTMIFMTSNLGAVDVQKAVGKQLGFSVSPVDMSKSIDGQLNRKLANITLAAAKRKFTPEFINRIDKIINFLPLTEEQSEKVLLLELDELNRILLERQKNILFYTTQAARELLLKEGFSGAYGARSLKRTLHQRISIPLAALMSSGQICFGDVVRVDRRPEENELVFIKDASDISIPRMQVLGRAVNAHRPTARTFKKALRAA
jgi:ATP-dependent Clp protease ATP-binding subunit ClpA